MPHRLQVIPFDRPFTATVTPPGSKSLTNRALVLAALADGPSVLSNLLASDDTAVMLQALRQLGFTVTDNSANGSIAVTGLGGNIPADSAELFCGNSGTTIRFLTAACTLGKGNYRLSGVPRMHERPIGGQVDLLRNLGARIDYTAREGYPPLRVHADALPGGMARFPASASSQYLSAVLMAAPYARNEVRIGLEPDQTSWPYVAMTMQLMHQFGITCELVRDPSTNQPRELIVPRGRYTAADYVVEPDASSATYFLAAAAIRPGAKLTIEGLGRRSLQGDVGFADLLHRMGADLVFGNDFITVTGTDRLDGLNVDLSDMPDAAMTLAAIAVFADGPTTLRGLHTLRVKETDRLAALQAELVRLGAAVDIENNDTLIIEPPEHLRPADIRTYDDHRMAMSFAVIGTRQPGVTILDPKCVAKTYPAFWQDLEKLRLPATVDP